MEKIGPDGIIKIESSSSIYTTVEVQEGMKVHLRGHRDFLSSNLYAKTLFCSVSNGFIPKSVKNIK